MSFRDRRVPREREAEGLRPVLQLLQDGGRLLLVQPRPADDERQEVPVMLAQEARRRDGRALPR